MRSRLAIALTSLCSVCLVSLVACQSGRSTEIKRQPRVQDEPAASTAYSTRRSFDLGYDFSGADLRDQKALDLWVQHRGQWSHVGRLDLPRDGASCTVDDDGTYGFLLTRPNPATGAQTLPAGTAPDRFVLVDTVLPVVVVSSPNGGEYLQSGGTANIEWTAFDRNLPATCIDLHWSADGGQTWTEIATGLKNSGRHAWKVPEGQSDNAFVRVTARDVAGNLGMDLSDIAFHLQGAGRGVTLTVADDSRFLPGTQQLDYALSDPENRSRRVSAVVTNPNDPSFRKVFYDDDNTSPITLTLPEGRYTVALNAVDVAGADIFDAPVTGNLLVGNEAIGLLLLSPAPDAILAPATLCDVRWAMLDASFGEYSVKLEMRPVDGAWETLMDNRNVRDGISWRTPAFPGEYQLRLTLTNADGKSLDTMTRGAVFVGTPNVTVTATRAFVNADGMSVVKFDVAGKGARLVNDVKVWLWRYDSNSWDVVKTYALLPEKIELPLPDGDFGLTLTAGMSSGSAEARPQVERDVEIKIHVDNAAARYSFPELREAYLPAESVPVTITGADDKATLLRVDLAQPGLPVRTVPADPAAPRALTVPLKQLSEGPFELRAVVRDGTGREVQIVRESYLDATGPQLLTSTSYILSGSQDVSVHYQVNDEGSGVAEASLELFDKDLKPYKTFPLDITANTIKIRLPEGDYHFKLKAKDKLGNTSVTDQRLSCYLSVDLTKPTVSLLTQVRDEDVKAGQAVNIRWDAKDANFGSAPISLYSSVDGGLTWQSIALLVENNGQYGDWTPPQGGNAQILLKVVARDLCGHIAEAVSKGVLRVDFDAAVAIATGPLHSKVAKVDLIYDLSAPKGVKVRAVELWFRAGVGEAWTRYESLDDVVGSPFPWTAPGSGEFGIYLRAIAEDGSGLPQPQAATPAQLSVTIDDRTQSYFVFDSGLDTIAGGSSQTLRWQVNEDKFVGRTLAVEFRASDAEPWRLVKSGLNARGSMNWTAPAQNASGAQLRLTAQTDNNNRAPVQLRTFAVDNDPPVFTLQAENKNGGRDITVKFTSRDNFGEAVKHIALWYSANQGTSWTRVPVDITSPYAFAAPTDGLYGFYLTGEDSAGNVVAAPVKGSRALAQVAVDTTPPTLRLISPEGGEDRFYPGHVPMQIRWQTTDTQLAAKPIRIFFSRDDAASWTLLTEEPVEDTGAWFWNIPGGMAMLPTRRCHIKITAEDSHGNVAETRTAQPFQIDAKAPTFTIGNKPPSVAKDQVVIQLDINDGDGSGAAPTLVKYRKRGTTEWLKYEVPYDGQDPNRIPFNAAEGSYEMYFVATDRVGNHSPLPRPDSKPHYAITIDRTSPAVAMDGIRAGEILTLREPRAVSWTATDADLSATPVTLRLRSGDVARDLAAGQPANGSYKLQAADLAGGSAWKLEVVCVDAAGNSGTASVDFAFDGAAPSVVAKVASEILEGKILLRGECADKDLARVDYYVRVNGGAWRACASQDSLQAVPFLLEQDGRYEFYAVGTDTNGNRAATPVDATAGQARLDCDIHGPALAFEVPEKSLWRGGANVQLQLNVNDYGTPVWESLIVELSEDGKTWNSIAGVEQGKPTGKDGAFKLPLSFVLPARDLNALLVRARIRDNSDNWGETRLAPLRVDSTPPKVVLTGIQDGQTLAAGKAVPLAWTVTNGAGKSVQVSWTSVDKTELIAAEQPDAGNLKWTPPVQPGASATYRIDVTAADTVGNTASASVTLHVDGEWPDVKVRVASEAVDGKLTLRAECADADLARVDYYVRVNGGAWRPCASKDTLEAVPFVLEQDGLYEFYTAGVDRHGNRAEAPGEKTVGQAKYECDIHGPALAFDAPARDVWSGGAPVQLTLKVNDYGTPAWDSLLLEVSEDGRAWSALSGVETGDPAKLDGGFSLPLAVKLPARDVNTLHLRARLRDDRGNWGETRLAPMRVDATPPSVDIIGVADGQMLAVGKAVTLGWTVRDGAGKSVRLTWNDGAASGEIAAGQADTGSLQWTPPAQAGTNATYRVDVAAMDAAGNPATASVVLHVDGVAPELNLVLQQAGRPGDLTLLAEGNDSMSGIAEAAYYARVDNGAWRRVVSKNTLDPVSYSMTEDGVYDFYVAGTDLVGNAVAAPVATTRPMATFTYDSVGPELALTPLAQTLFKAGATVDVELIAKDVLGVDASSVAFSFSEDGGFTWNPVTPASLKDAAQPDKQQHTFRATLTLPDHDVAGLAVGAQLKDASGNVGAMRLDGLVVDATPPNVQLVTVAGRRFFAPNSACEVRWAVTDAHPEANNATLTLVNGAARIVVGNKQSWNGSYTYDLTGADPDKVFTLTVDVVDAVGNAGTASIEFGVDARVPQSGIAVLDGPVNGQVQLRVSGEDDGVGLKRLVVYARMAGRPWEKIATLDEPGDLVYRFEEDGRYDFYVLGEDLAGNRDPWPAQPTRPSLSMVYDLGRPSMAFSPSLPRYLAGGSRQQVVLVASDNLSLDAATLGFSYSVKGSGEWKPMRLLKADATASEQTGRTEYLCTLELPFESIEAMVVRARMADGSGNVGEVFSEPVVLDHEVPQAVCTKVTPLDDGEIEIEYTSHDEGFSGCAWVEIWLKADGEEWKRHGEPGEDFGEPIRTRVAEGSYKISLVSIDAAGNRETQPSGANDLFAEQVFRARPGLPAVALSPSAWNAPLRGDAKVELRWESTGNHLAADSVNIAFSADKGASWETLFKQQPLSGSVDWRVPLLDAAECLLRVTVRDSFGQIGSVDSSAFAIDSTGDGVQLIFGEGGRKTPDDPGVMLPSEETKPAKQDGDNGNGQKQPDTPTDSGASTTNVPPDNGTTTEPNEYETPAPEEVLSPDSADPDKMSLDELLYMGRVKLKIAEYAEAKNFFDHALRLDPRNAEAHGGLGRIYYRQRDRHLARKHFEQAVQYKSADYEVYMDFGVLAYSEQKWEESRSMFYTASATYKGKDGKAESRILFNLGASEYVLRNFRNGLAAFKAALVKDDDNTRCLVYIAKCYTELFRADVTSKSDWDNAVHYWKKTIDSFGYNSENGVEAREALAQLEPMEPKESK